MSRTIYECGLIHSQAEKLYEKGIRFYQDLLISPPTRISAILDLGLKELDEFLNDISSKNIPEVRNAWNIYNERKENSFLFGNTNLVTLDEALHGGIPASSLTEICGCGGIGKSQFCFGLSVTCVTKKEFGGWSEPTHCYNVLYLDTERKFMPERIIEIAKNKYPEYYNQTNALERLISNINMISIDTINDFEQVVNRLETMINSDTKLIVIDSIAALFRRNFSNEEIPKRQSILMYISSELKRIAESHSIIILITNQIMAKYNDNDNFSPFSFHDKLLPTLGTSWHHCISTRLILDHYSKRNSVPNDEDIVGNKRKREDDIDVRTLIISKSPIARNHQIYYMINSEGLCELDHY